jgi:hypothetical protein
MSDIILSSTFLGDEPPLMVFGDPPTPSNGDIPLSMIAVGESEVTYRSKFIRIEKTYPLNAWNSPILTNNEDYFPKDYIAGYWPTLDFNSPTLRNLGYAPVVYYGAYVTHNSGIDGTLSGASVQYDEQRGLCLNFQNTGDSVFFSGIPYNMHHLGLDGSISSEGHTIAFWYKTTKKPSSPTTAAYVVVQNGPISIFFREGSEVPSTFAQLYPTEFTNRTAGFTASDVSFTGALRPNDWNYFSCSMKPLTSPIFGFSYWQFTTAINGRVVQQNDVIEGNGYNRLAYPGLGYSYGPSQYLKFGSGDAVSYADEFGVTFYNTTGYSGSLSDVLFIDKPLEISEHVDLYRRQKNRFFQTPEYMQPISIESSVLYHEGMVGNLFIKGYDTDSRNIPLHLEGEPLPDSSIPLCIWGVQDSGTQAALFFIEKTYPYDYPHLHSLANYNSVWEDGQVAFWPMNEGHGPSLYNNTFSKHSTDILRADAKYFYWDGNLGGESGVGSNDEYQWDFDQDFGKIINFQEELGPGGTDLNIYGEINNYTSGTIDATGAITLSAWVRRKSPKATFTTLEGPIISWQFNRGYDLRLVGGYSGIGTGTPVSTIRFAINGYTVGDVISGGVENSIRYDDTDWHHITAVAMPNEYTTPDPSGSGSGEETGVFLSSPPDFMIFGGISPGSGNGTMKLYLDGLLIAQGPCTFPIAYNTGDKPRLFKTGTEDGIDNFLKDTFFHGCVKDVRVYRDRAFEADEVWNSYTSYRDIYMPIEGPIPVQTTVNAGAGRFTSLFIDGVYGADEGLNLFIQGELTDPFFFNSTGVPLFAKGKDDALDFDPSLDLYIHSPVNEDLNLYIGGGGDSSLSINLNMIGVAENIGCGQLNELYLKVWTPTDLSENLNLWVEASAKPLNSQFDLYMSGGEFDNWVDGVDLYIHPVYTELFIRGKDDGSGDLNLYINSIDDFSSSIPLFISTIEQSPIDLFIHGFDVSNESLNLYLQGNPITPLDSRADLWMFSTNSTGFTSGLDLYLKTSEIEGEWLEDMPLYLETVAFEEFDESMNLCIEGGWSEFDSTLPLYLHNSVLSATDSIDLWIIGSGERDGFITFDDSMNLFIETAIGQQTPLYINGYIPGISGDFDLFLNAASSTYDNDIKLVMPKTSDKIIKQGNLFVRGW